MVFWTLCLLAGCEASKNERLLLLAELERQNSTGEQMFNDSLAESLVEYFDHHGTANERMRAKYILGRTYFCLGELPRALQTYFEAADCADTTAADCDFAKLSRIHAQSAVIYYEQILPINQLKELRQAVYYAKKGQDTLITIECYAQQADAYKLLHMNDSAISIKEKASEMYRIIGKSDRAALTLITTVTSLLNSGKTEKAQRYLHMYETESGVFDEKGCIEEGRRIYYYIKGCYYLTICDLDSAEYMFRKELKEGKDLNNQIAGCKGLQKVYEKRLVSDSIAKYANLCYELNDSAYSLSAMQNIQKLQVSYNYNHNKFIAEKKKLEAERAWLIVVILSLISLVVTITYIWKYNELKHVAVDYFLKNAKITNHLKKLANSNPVQYPSFDDWKELRTLVEHKIPSFRKSLKVDELPLTEMDYDVCLMIRVHLLPIEISKLKQCSPSHVTNIRKRLLLRIFGKEGSSDDFDDEIGKISK